MEAEENKDKKPQNIQGLPSGFTTFRRKRYYAVGGILLMAVGVGLFFLSEDTAMMKYIWSMVTVAAGLLFLLSVAVSRADVDDEKIVYRNLFGRTRQLRWQDIRQVMDGIDMDRNILLFGENTKIRITYGFARFDSLREIILRKTGYGNAQQKPQREKRNPQN